MSQVLHACRTIQYHFVHIAFNGILITDVNRVQVNGIIYVVPHVVVVLNVVIKALKTKKKIIVCRHLLHYGIPWLCDPTHGFEYCR